MGTNRGDHANSAGVPALLIEDHTDDAGLVIAALANPPGRYLLRQVRSFAAARSAVNEERYECLVVDVTLPDSDRLEMIEALRRHSTDAAIVVLTSNSDDDVCLRTIQSGADDCLLKSETSSRQVRCSVDHALERKRSEIVLREQTARSVAVLAALAEGVMVLDVHGCIVSVNPAAETFLSVAGADLLGRHISSTPSSVVSSDGTSTLNDNGCSRLTLESGRPLDGVEAGVHSGAGEVSWIEVNTNPLLSPDGQADGVVVSMRDCSERMMAEEGARFQSALLSAIGQSVVVTDPQGRVVFWNQAAERMHGWTTTEALGKPAAELVAPVSVAQAREIAQGTSWTGDVQVRRRDGTQFPALIADTPVFDDFGHLAAVISISTDISERKQAEEAAKALAAIVESTGDAIFTKSVEGIILTWNRGAEQLYGHSAQDAIGCHVNILSPHGVRDEVETIIATVLAGETVRGLETIRSRRDGGLVEVSLTVSPIFDEGGSVQAASVIAHDISTRCRLERELVRQAMEDTLTGLPNRSLFADRLAQALAGCGRRGAPVAVLFIDLDHFKNVNDTNGHLVGDELLVRVARRFREVMRPADTVARFGGDEFVIVCEDADQAVAERVADRIAATLQEPFEIAGERLFITASVGIAVTPPLAADGGVLLSNADAAMYEAKARGRSQSRVFDALLSERSNQRLELANELREALSGDDLDVNYQPVVELSTGNLIGLEALVRWEHPTLGWVSPALFVPLAEEAGFAAILDAWVLARACRDGETLRAWGVLPTDAKLAVNISATTIADPALIDVVRDAAKRGRLPLTVLELEVTETGLLTDLPAACVVLTALRELGIGIALDDFGTGYSSLTNIRQLPVTTVKIDRSFVQNMASRPDDLAVAASVVDLAEAMELRTIAEGVETSAQLALLQRLGCIAGQGYLWSAALPRDELAALLRQNSGGFPVTAPPALTRRTGQLPAPVTNQHGLHRIVALSRGGGSPTTIAAALNADGYYTPQGLRWHTTSVSRVIAGLASTAT